MKDEKKVKATEEEAKKEVKTEENGVELTDEELEQVTGGTNPINPSAIMFANTIVLKALMLSESPQSLDGESNK